MASQSTAGKSNRRLGSIRRHQRSRDIQYADEPSITLSGHWKKTALLPAQTGRSDGGNSRKPQARLASRPRSRQEPHSHREAAERYWEAAMIFFEAARKEQAPG